MLPVNLAPEWKRIELLCAITQKSRSGAEPDAAQLEALSALQNEVLTARQGNCWGFLGLENPSQLALDVLALILAPEVSHIVSFAYSGLGEDASGREISLRLIQALLSMSPEDLPELLAELGAGGQLVGAGLVTIDRRGGIAHLRAGRTLRTLLLGLEGLEPPPGTTIVSRKAGWSDLVVSPGVVSAMREFLGIIRHRALVEGIWGAQRRGGPVALFSGSSGTGKTLAALVIAAESGAPLFRVDLGQLVSKYIGETEKNLNLLFDSVNGTNAILLFDESDALFGKRGEVKDARDRYANMEVSHLLSRIEGHFSPCILTTNLRSSIDPAFMRRFHVIVDFPFPDADERLRLWERHLPPRAPRDPDIDLELVSETMRLTGASIENAALHAAYAAAANHQPISMRHVVNGIWNELSKEGSGRSLRQLGPLARWIEEQGNAADRPADTQVAA
jgi:ATPase family associated with various cellular activities (AAA)